MLSQHHPHRLGAVLATMLLAPAALADDWASDRRVGSTRRSSRRFTTAWARPRSGARRQSDWARTAGLG